MCALRTALPQCPVHEFVFAGKGGGGKGVECSSTAVGGGARSAPTEEATTQEEGLAMVCVCFL